MLNSSFKKIMAGLFLVALIGVGLLIYFVVTDITAQQSDDETATAETNEEETSTDQIEETQKTVGKDHVEVGDFVSDTHDFYNETTGYGRTASIDWDEQRSKAEEVLSEIENLSPDVEFDPLQNDLSKIKGLANNVMDGEDLDDVRDLHRMFHDLDIALNSYNGSDKIWNVTETLE
ncbi:hypothetical protein LF817_11930 [Halobacillus sp. A1]|uniref:hypothetical protein n=1 Tax=Halobacillus sp. A1 TaxID=2880262 RepID=UPI0020A64C6A|nr:hypothetical protein [Halobacillus sp. A1]MCP3032055.1 hypothetical protein [Halobacillus sp. A1]